MNQSFNVIAISLNIWQSERVKPSSPTVKILKGKNVKEGSTGEISDCLTEKEIEERNAREPNNAEAEFKEEEIEMEREEGGYLREGRLWLFRLFSGHCCDLERRRRSWKCREDVYGVGGK